MADGVVLVHEIAVVPKAIPVVFVDGLFVEVKVFGKLALYGRMALVACGQTPDSEGMRVMQILRCAHEWRVLCLLLCALSDGSLAGVGTFGDER